MADVKITTISEGPEEGKGKTFSFSHPITEFPYDIALFQVNGKYYALPDLCGKCPGSLGEGTLDGMYVLCSKDQTPWHIKHGLCRYNRNQGLPSYKVKVENQDLIITI